MDTTFLTAVMASTTALVLQLVQFGFDVLIAVLPIIFGATVAFAVVYGIYRLIISLFGKAKSFFGKK